jgi:hypothetical protein
VRARARAVVSPAMHQPASASPIKRSNRVVDDGVHRVHSELACDLEATHLKGINRPWSSQGSFPGRQADHDEAPVPQVNGRDARSGRRSARTRWTTGSVSSPWRPSCARPCTTSRNASSATRRRSGTREIRSTPPEWSPPANTVAIPIDLITECRPCDQIPSVPGRPGLTDAITPTKRSHSGTHDLRREADLVSSAASEIYVAVCGIA